MIRKIRITQRVMKKDGCEDMKQGSVTSKKQISLINQLYLGQTFEESNVMSRNIKTKLRSYRSQDLKKSRFDEINFIKYDDLLEKLVICKLKCTYCRLPMLIMYQNKREPTQWTLDRIDNSTGHTNSNTVIACLKCNLERRCINDQKFKFTKQMRLIKKK